MRDRVHVVSEEEIRELEKVDAATMPVNEAEPAPDMGMGDMDMDFGGFDDGGFD